MREGATDLSIIVPTYNGERFIRETITSVSKQVPLPAELIVVDDGSTDKTLSVIRAAAPNSIRIRIVEKASNSGGPACPINTGISLATTKWIYVLDQDDLMLEDSTQTFERMKQLFPAENVVGGMVKRFVDPCSTLRIPDDVLYFWPSDFPEENDDAWILPKGMYRFLFDNGMILNGFPGFYFTRESWSSVGCLNESFKVAADFDFVLRLLSHYNIAIAKRAIYRYRFHGSNLSGNKPVMLLEDLRAKYACYLRMPVSEREALRDYMVKAAERTYHWSRKARRYDIALEALKVLSSLKGPVFSRLRLRIFLNAHRFFLRIN